MSNKTQFKPRQLHDGTWLVDVPPWLSNTAKRQRKFFQSRAEALAFAEELRARRDNLAFQPDLSAAQLCEAAAAFKILDDRNRTDLRLSDIVIAYFAIEATRQESTTLGKLLAEYEANRQE